MTYWLTISFIVSLAIFVTRIDADVERLNVGADTNTNSLIGSDTSKDSAQNNERLTKRASFMPSRGKKEQQFADGTVADNGADKRAAAAFMPMRGRKDYYSPQQAQGWYVGGPQYANLDYQSGGMESDKRAGFMPMRGRKDGGGAYEPVPAPASYFYNDVYPLELNDMKRMSSFMPMRGRKDDMTYNQLSYTGQPSYAVPQPQPYSQSTHNIDNTNWMEGEHSLSVDGSRQGGPGGPVSASGDMMMSVPQMEKKANAFFGARGKRHALSGSESDVHKRSVSGGGGGGQEEEHHHKYTENFFATRG